MQPREQGCCLQFCFSCFYSLFTFFLTHPPLLALVTNIVFALPMERKEREKRLHDQFITHKAVAFSLYPFYSNILDKTKKQKKHEGGMKRQEVVVCTPKEWLHITSLRSRQDKCCDHLLFSIILL